MLKKWEHILKCNNQWCALWHVSKNSFHNVLGYKNLEFVIYKDFFFCSVVHLITNKHNTLFESNSMHAFKKMCQSPITLQKSCLLILLADKGRARCIGKWCNWSLIGIALYQLLSFLPLTGCVLEWFNQYTIPLFFVALWPIHTIFYYVMFRCVQLCTNLNAALVSNEAIHTVAFTTKSGLCV